MGDRLRTETGAKDVLARLAAYLLVTARARIGESPGRVAWLLRSLKRPEEVDALRRLYGPRFILLGLHVPDGERRRNAAKRWQRRANVTSTSFEDEAAIDVRRDELDRTTEYGQGRQYVTPSRDRISSSMAGANSVYETLCIERFI